MIIVLTSALWEDHGTEGPPPAAAKAVAATVEEIAGAIAAGGWVVLVILAVINVSVCLKVKKIDIAAYFNQ